MKIKFLKPFRLYNPIGDDMMMGYMLKRRWTIRHNGN